jgi:bifunctional non-homologous end joining protein LigD
MSLVKYNEKRKFDKTPEPKGGEAKAKSLIFVIQKHDRAIHRSFRQTTCHDGRRPSVRLQGF